LDVTLRLFEDYSASRLNFRKFHHMKHAADDIEEHGSTAIYNTGPDETAHKEGPKVHIQIMRSYMTSYMTSYLTSYTRSYGGHI
jgi:hypothetical protein